MTDAGYLDEPTVVWERLNEIDGDTEYFNANFLPLNASETNQQSILTRQEQEKRALDEANRLQEAAATAGSVDNEAENGNEAMDQESTDKDPDYLFALRLQEEEEARVNGGRPKRVSPVVSPRRNPSPVSQHRQEPFPPANFGDISESDDSGNDREASSREPSQFEDTTTAGDQAGNSGGRNSAVTGSGGLGVQSDDMLPFTEDGQLLLSEEELEAQRQAERFYQERKRHFEQQAYQIPPPQQQHQQPRGSNTANCSSARPSKEDKGDCSLM